MPNYKFSNQLINPAYECGSASYELDNPSPVESHQPLIDLDRQKAYLDRLLENWKSAESRANRTKPLRGPPPANPGFVCNRPGKVVPRPQNLGEKAAIKRDRARYIATPEAAQYLGLSESYLNKARHFGTGPDYVRFGRAIRYDVDVLEAWAQARSVSARAEGE